MLAIEKSLSYQRIYQYVTYLDNKIDYGIFFFFGKLLKKKGKRLPRNTQLIDQEVSLFVQNHLTVLLPKGNISESTPILLFILVSIGIVISQPNSTLILLLFCGVILLIVSLPKKIRDEYFQNKIDMNT